MAKLCILYLMLVSVALIPLGAEITQEKVNKAIKLGTKYLIRKQEQNGSWGEKHAEAYPMGNTSLVVLTLIKCKVDPNHQAVQKAFKYLEKQRFDHTYGVALYLMAMEAKYATMKDKIKKSKYKKIHPFQLFANKKDKKRVLKACKSLMNSISGHRWGYPAGEGDNSNTQYAMLGLFAAERMGIKIKQKIYLRVAQYFVKSQERDGPAVRPFTVPAADEPISAIQRKKLKKLKEKYKHKKPNSYRPLYPRFHSGTTMKARGWGYRNSDKITGSMTTAGIACVVICKAYLEKSRTRKWQRLLPQVNQAIRDGCGWMAKNFKVKKNPGGGSKFYYLYGLERAGVLTGLENFGTHNWYLEGAKEIISKQTKQGNVKEISSTCFALLFLNKATVPVRTVTKLE